MNKNYFDALKEKTRLESYECGKYGKVKNEYRVIFCQDSGEYIVQRKFREGWLCLHK